MSGDVQPRKRKDKKKKRDSLDPRSEGELITPKLSFKDDEDVKESHHGVHVTKMGSDDVHIHVQSEHGTGGHWCAKLFFFSLLALLFGLVGLIILENRGLSDLDTPLSESRFSEYFEGWVEEHRQGIDDQHTVKTGLEDNETAPFEEEEDHSEQEEDDADIVGHETDHSEEDDDEHVEKASNTEDDDDNEDEVETIEDVDKKEENDDAYDHEDKEDFDDEDQKDDDGDEDDNIKLNDEAFRDKREIQDDDDVNDEGFEDDDNNNEEDDNNNEEDIDGNQYDINNDNDSGADDVASDEDKGQPTTQNAIDDDAPFEEEDDDDFDDNEDSLEEVVDNDAGELLHLRYKAEQEEFAAKAAEIQEEEESNTAPQIQPNIRGAQSYSDDDEYIDEEIRRANEELFNDQFDFQ